MEINQVISQLSYFWFMSWLKFVVVSIVSLAFITLVLKRPSISRHSYFIKFIMTSTFGYLFEITFLSTFAILFTFSPFALLFNFYQQFYQSKVMSFSPCW